MRGKIYMTHKRQCHKNVAIEGFNYFTNSYNYWNALMMQCYFVHIGIRNVILHKLGPWPLLPILGLLESTISLDMLQCTVVSQDQWEFLSFTKGHWQSLNTSPTMNAIWQPLGLYKETAKEWKEGQRNWQTVSTHLPLDKMAASSQTIFSDAFSWMKNFVFWLKFHWSLFLRVQLTITQHWFR